MPRRPSIRLDPPESISGTAEPRDNDPEPEPEPPVAPPIIILSQSGSAPAAPHSQVPGPARVQPQLSTSFASDHKSVAPRYDFRDRKVAEKKRPDKPTVPEPNPAPPVIILSHKRPATASPARSPPPIHIPTSVRTSIAPTVAATFESTTATNRAATKNTSSKPITPRKRTMGSKSSKLSPSHGKLQPSQDRQDKEEMKEPSNYYTHRSKSMRRAAGKGKGGAAAGAAGAGAEGIGGAV